MGDLIDKVSQVAIQSTMTKLIKALKDEKKVPKMSMVMGRSVL